MFIYYTKQQSERLPLSYILRGILLTHMYYSLNHQTRTKPRSLFRTIGGRTSRPESQEISVAFPRMGNYDYLQLRTLIFSSVQNVSSQWAVIDRIIHYYKSSGFNLTTSNLGWLDYSLAPATNLISIHPDILSIQMYCHSTSLHPTKTNDFNFKTIIIVSATTTIWYIRVIIIQRWFRCLFRNSIINQFPSSSPYHLLAVPYFIKI